MQIYFQFSECGYLCFIVKIDTAVVISSFFTFHFSLFFRTFALSMAYNIKRCRERLLLLILFLAASTSVWAINPLKWFAENWTAYDSTYSVPVFYDWCTMAQNTTSQEWLSMDYPEGMRVSMRSEVSNRLGPYFGYRWLLYGYTIDLNTIGKPSKLKNEFTLSINSNLMNIDIIRRRTGGDFDMKELSYHDASLGRVDLLDFVRDYEPGDYIKNSLTGVNVNYFVNHLRYSNPAAFSNGAIQLRSAGSPIIGFGYTHQKVESEVSDIFASNAVEIMTNSAVASGNIDELLTIVNTLDEDAEATPEQVLQILDLEWPSLKNNAEQSRLARSFLTNRIPTQSRIEDWHLQLGYAYNHVFSRRLLLGVSLIAAPGLKRFRANNIGSAGYVLNEGLCRLAKKHEGVDLSPDYFRYSYDATHFNLNLFGRASLTFNYNHWVAGFNASFSHYNYNHDGMKVRNSFGSVSLYVAYFFGLQKPYRKGGPMRHQFERTAL